MDGEEAARWTARRAARWTVKRAGRETARKAGTSKQVGTGAESGGGESGGVSGAGPDPAGAESSTDGSGSADEAGLGSLVSRAGCAEDCDLPGALTDGGEGHAIRTAGGAEAAGEFEDEGVALSASKATDTHPAVLALFALMALGLLVGLAGGLREFLTHQTRLSRPRRGVEKHAAIPVTRVHERVPVPAPARAAVSARNAGRSYEPASRKNPWFFPVPPRTAILDGRGERWSSTGSRAGSKFARGACGDVRRARGAAPGATSATRRPSGTAARTRRPRRSARKTSSAASAPGSRPTKDGSPSTSREGSASA